MGGLADVVVDQALFLATAGDREIHPDVAVKQLEALAFAASRFPEDQKEALRASIAARIESASDPERVALRELAGDLGL